MFYYKNIITMTQYYRSAVIADTHRLVLRTKKKEWTAALYNSGYNF